VRAEVAASGESVCVCVDGGSDCCECVCVSVCAGALRAKRPFVLALSSKASTVAAAPRRPAPPRHRRRARAHTKQRRPPSRPPNQFAAASISQHERHPPCPSSTAIAQIKTAHTLTHARARHRPFPPPSRRSPPSDTTPQAPQRCSLYTTHTQARDGPASIVA
jgi:hypothetical protein